MTFWISATLAFLIGFAFYWFDQRIASQCGRNGKYDYHLCPNAYKEFHEVGLAILPNVLTEEEVQEIERMYDKYMAEGSPEKQGRDFCDMSKPYNTSRENYSVINGMLPRRYYPEFQNSIYEQIATKLAHKLFPGTPMVLDYDQLLDKVPNKHDAVFAWHQDMAYWPPPRVTPDTRTVTFSLALDTTTEENGCIRYVPGSGAEKKLRVHAATGKDKHDAHAISATVGEDEVVSYAKVPRGSLSIHDEYIVHGSGGNKSNGKRRTYVIAFRTADTVKRERAMGFSHSHNDDVNWDKFNEWK
jgi:phytanoyl-CoA hydroxylase